MSLDELILKLLALKAEGHGHAPVYIESLAGVEWGMPSDARFRADAVEIVS
ncbi:hypothetical protein N1031_06780 [Herbiconiux moechotypicola]|uniref:Uncharacterized protein n=1 Tax=Herbiconiux moechotypicola TaxID=637393 RepID=A0ABP5Q9Z5_9MICO|nr:hypothetical protein [Herbiconiux moechotypicola]MCS5729462.1 hypothetical protein [Herbiconiux moechotypicola]